MRASRPHAVLALSALLFFAGGAVADELAAPQPVAAFSTLTHDFGEVVRGDTLRYTFTVRNDGDAVLEIQSVHPT